MSTGVPVGITDSQLAVLLRQAQWALDDAAHDLPVGRATGGQREQLAATLETLALVLRAPVPDHAGHPNDKPAGWIRTLLLETGVELRPRGGDHRSRQ